MAAKKKGPAKTAAKRLGDKSLANLESTLDVLCAELRARAPRPVEAGGLNNMELIGAVKALESIRVQALSLLEDEGGAETVD